MSVRTAGGTLRTGAGRIGSVLGGVFVPKWSAAPAFTPASLASVVAWWKVAGAAADGANVAAVPSGSGGSALTPGGTTRAVYRASGFSAGRPGLSFTPDAGGAGGPAYTDGTPLNGASSATISGTFMIPTSGSLTGAQMTVAGRELVFKLVVEADLRPHLLLSANGSSWSLNVIASNPLVRGVPYVYTITLGGGTAVLRLNGSQVLSAAFTGSLASTSTPFLLGGINSAGAYPVLAVYGDQVLANTVLSSADLTALEGYLAALVTPAPTASVPSTSSTVTYTDPDMTSLRTAEIPAAGTYGVGLPLRHLFNVFSESMRDVTRAPLHPNSAALVANIATQQIPSGSAATLNNTSYGHPVYVVRADQPRVAVGFRDEQRKGYTVGGYFDGDAHFLSVPIPPDAVSAAGTDAAITIWCPETDQLWEFWQTKKDYSPKNSDGSTKALGGVPSAAAAAGTFTYASGITTWSGWSAAHGGRIDNVSQSYGSFPYPYGITATGVASGSTAVSVEDVRAGVINHAMSLQLYQPRSGNESYPATRNDGWTTNSDAPYEGQRFRLKASVNVDALSITPIAKMIAKAAQKYGFIVTDKAGTLAVPAEEGSAYVKAEGSNPWTSLLAGKANWQVLDGFPWGQLEALPFNYGAPGHVSGKAASPTRFRSTFAQADRAKVTQLPGLQVTNDGGYLAVKSGRLALGGQFRALGIGSVQMATLSQWAELDVAVLSGHATTLHPQLHVRMSVSDTASPSATPPGYWARYNPASGTAAWQLASGNGVDTPAVRASTPAAVPTAPYTLRLEVTHDSDSNTAVVRVYVNGAVVIEYTDPTPPPVGYAAGIQLAYTAAVDANTRVSRWEFGDLTADTTNTALAAGYGTSYGTSYGA